MTSHIETIHLTMYLVRYKNAQGKVEETNKPKVVKSTFMDL